ncbi:hypothetical protein DVH24_002294 [Malus domestica]|uniref:Uncharacterized protein n=1 Tax=Malus domestica TaxID=3750 RepID=A0A498I5J2_MALDO|nr:hypothetical protein DVH24_002294 [Malus domestica]
MLEKISSEVENLQPNHASFACDVERGLLQLEFIPYHDTVGIPITGMRSDLEVIPNFYPCPNNYRNPYKGEECLFGATSILRVCTQHDDVPFITLQITHTRVSHMLVDGEASVNLVFKDIVEHMGLLNDITKT